MGALAFFGDETRKRVAETIKAVELETCAELVVSVRRVSASYRAADYLFGFALALLTLVALLFLPQPFDIRWWPVDLLLAFVAGAVISANVPPLRRLLVGTERLHREVQKAAHAAFHEQGISRTRDRCGTLVYVSIFERHGLVVTDSGVDLAALGPEWKSAAGAIEQAIAREDLEQFLAALKSLGPVLGRAHPRSDDDVNELPDEMHVA